MKIILDHIPSRPLFSKPQIFTSGLNVESDVRLDIELVVIGDLASQESENEHADDLAVGLLILLANQTLPNGSLGPHHLHSLDVFGLFLLLGRHQGRLQPRGHTRGDGRGSHGGSGERGSLSAQGEVLVAGLHF